MLLGTTFERAVGFVAGNDNIKRIGGGKSERRHHEDGARFKAGRGSWIGGQSHSVGNQINAVARLREIKGNREKYQVKRAKCRESASLPEEVGEDFAGFAQQAVVKEPQVHGGFGADVTGFGVAASMCRKACGRLDGAGSADGEEDGAVVESGVNFVHIVGNFAEPADVRTNLSATFATWESGGRLVVELSVFKGRAGTGIAAGFEEFAVHVNHAGGTAALVKVVDILGAKEQAVLQFALNSSNRQVCGIRLGLGGVPAAHGIKTPDELRIASPSDGCGDIFDAVIAPKAISITEGGNAALGGDTGTGEDEEAVGGSEFEIGHRNKDTGSVEVAEERERDKEQRSARGGDLNGKTKSRAPSPLDRKSPPFVQTAHKGWGTLKPSDAGLRRKSR